MIRLLRETYIHFAAVVGALSLASLATSLLDVEWQGVLLHLISWWAETVRPVIVTIYSPLLHLLSDILAIDFYLPIVAQDYLGVGLALILSRLRGAFDGWKRASTKPAYPSSPKILKKNVISSITRKPFMAASLLLRTLFIWPLELALMLQKLLFARQLFPDATDEYIRGVRTSHAVALLPVLYFLLLVIANWVLWLFPGIKSRLER